MRSTAIAVVVLAAVLVDVFTKNEAWSTASYLGVLVGASIGAWIGAARAPHGQRLVPGLIALGISLTALGDTLWSVLDLLGAGTDVSLADPPWFTSYVVLCAALWVVLVRGRPGRRVDMDFVIDAVTIVVVSVIIFWTISIDTIVADDSVSPFVRTVWAAYPIADAVLLALVVRVLMSRTARASLDASFAVGVCLWLAADIAYLHDPGSGVLPGLMDAAWMVAPVLMTRAAWRPHVAPVEIPDSSARTGWVALLIIAVGPLFVPPALEVVGDLRGSDHPGRLLTSSVVLITLAFVRTARLVRSEEHSRRELEAARDEALEASRAKSMFLANVSHEIRTPLTTVLATGEILEDTELDELQVNLLSKMHRSGELLKTLVEGILDFSRIEAGQLVLASTSFDLHAMVADTADVYLSRAEQQGLGFEWHLFPGVPRHVVGDSGRVFQVLTNLLENALKFTEQGHVSLVVRPAGPGPRGGGADEAVEFVVSDTGIGIREEDQDSVFDSFRQVDGSTTRRYGGTGLGLAICKELTRLMGGSITVHSQFGAGSTFVACIPMSQEGRGQAASSSSGHARAQEEARISRAAGV